VRLADLTLDELRLHLAGDPGVVDALYELLANNTGAVLVRDPDQPTRAARQLAAAAVRPAGFGPDDGLLPLPRRVPAAHRLLQELFILPQKFHFVDVAGVGDALRALGCGGRAELFFLVTPFERPERRSTLELGLTPESVRLGCTPAVNLFAQTAEPILLTERQLEYPVVPDARRRLEVETWAVDDVKVIRPSAGEVRQVAPLYAHRHGLGESGGAGLFWHGVRRPTGWRTDRGTEVFLSFADLSGRARTPEAEVASLSLTCFNGDLPSRLPFGVDERGDFELVPGGPVRRVRALIKPTAVLQPALGRSLLWRSCRRCRSTTCRWWTAARTRCRSCCGCTTSATARRASGRSRGSPRCAARRRTRAWPASTGWRSPAGGASRSSSTRSSSRGAAPTCSRACWSGSSRCRRR
jgi:type VI secretion system protein ImpG